MTSTKFNMVSEANGSITISNEESNITIHPDGTIAISSYAPVQLTGACAAKLDHALPSNDMIASVKEALGRRYTKKN